MSKIVTIKGEPIIDVYESYDGSYWYITEMLYKQDSIIDGKVYNDDQILFGYARLSACTEYAEFGNISETELKLLGSRVWKVPKENWGVCPDVEVGCFSEQQAELKNWEGKPSQPSGLNRFESHY